VDYDPASIIDEYLAVLESDYKLSREELTGPFFRSTHGVDGLKFVQLLLESTCSPKLELSLLPNMFFQTLLDSHLIVGEEVVERMPPTPASM
jgi:hypothetical protein